MRNPRWPMIAVTFIVVAIVPLVLSSCRPTDRSNDQPREDLAKHKHLDNWTKVRFEIIVLETGTDRPIPEARVLVVKQDSPQMEHLAPPTDHDGHTKFDLSVYTEKHYIDEKAKCIKYLYVSSVDVSADGYEDVTEPFSSCIEDQRYHTQDVLPPIVIRLRRQHLVTGEPSGETTGIARKAEGNATGRWTWGHTTSKYQEALETLEMKQVGENLSGTLPYSVGGQRVGDVVEIKDGKIENDKIIFKEEKKIGTEVHKAEYIGKLKGNTIRGSVEFRHGDRDSSIQGWEAKRVVD